MKLKLEFFKILVFTAIFNLTVSICNAQTFDCYITNDHLASTTEYEFDVYVKATSTDFRIRTIQFAFSFNLGFVPTGSNVTTIYVPGSSQMVNFTPGAIQQSTPSASISYAFQVGANTGFTCANGTNVLSGQRIRIGTWRITSSLPFNCIPANPSIIRPSDPQFGSPVLLKFLISRWNTLDCSSGTLNTIFSNNGTFTTFSGNTLLDSLNNMRPTLSVNPVDDTVCSDAGTASFTVVAQGNGTDIISNPLSYQWFEGNTILTNSTIYSGVTSSTLVLSNPSFSLNGNLYSCKVSQGNPASVERNSSSALLSIIQSDDNNACTIDNCDVTTGTVTHTLLSDIDDNDLCTDDYCDPATGSVSHTINWTPDLNLCDIESCDPLTGIVTSNPVNIDDNNACTIDDCDPTTGSINHTGILSLNTGSTPASCSGNDGTATVFQTGGSSPISYLWSPGGQTSQTATGLQGGNYNVTVTDGNGCSNSISVIVTTTGTGQSPGPINGPEFVCSNNNCVVYCIDSVPGFSEYVWTLPPGTLIVGESDGKCITVKFNSNFCGGDICVSPVSNCGNIYSCLPLEKVNSKPIAPGNISGTNLICPLSTGIFSVTPVPKATGYTWTASGGLTITSGQGSPVIYVNSLSGFNSGTISVRAFNCEGTSSKKTITISGLPATPLWDNDNKKDNPVTVCGGSTYKYELKFNHGVSCYLWSAPNGAIVYDRNGNSGNPLLITSTSNDDVTITFPQGFISGTVSVSACNSCGSGNAATLDVRSLPLVPGIITGSQSVCKYSTKSYSISKMPDVKYYNWSVTGGAIIYSGQGTNKIKVKFNATNTTSVDLSVTAKNKCGFSDASFKTINVNLNCKSVENEISENEISDESILSLVIFPNPVTHQINVSLNSYETGNGILKLTDISGKEIFVKQINIIKGNNTFSADASNLAGGIYFIWIISNEKRWMQKILLSR